jgi:cytochrome b6
MILDWTEIGYWRLKIELGIVASIPLIGAQLRDILTGGGAVGTATVERLYTIHSYILSVGAIALAVVHLASLLLQEKGLRVKVELEADPAAPDSEVELEQTEKALY